MLEFSLGSAAPAGADTPCAIVGVFEEGPSPAAAEIDAASGGVIAGLRESGDFTGKRDTTLLLHGVKGVTAPRVLLVGLGARDKFDEHAFERACGAAGKAAKRLPADEACTWLPQLEVRGRGADWRVRTCALAIDHACFRYTATLKPENGDAPRLAKLVLVAGGDADRGLGEARAIARGVTFARELGCLPPNLCTPSHIAAQAKTIADGRPDVSLEVLEREDMEKLGMGALLAVASGSATPPKLIVLQYRGGGKAKPYALVGKGVTFDTGGMNLKPTGSMEEMKYDMCGAAGVLGAFL
jgi:leucyl aminopeptidase